MNYDLSTQLHPTQLKIQGHEIREAIGFDHSWVAGMRFFLLCLAADDLSDLSQLLDLVDEHNHLVSAIEIDLQKAIANPQNEILQELEDVVLTFSQTKHQVLAAIAQQSIQNSTDGIGHNRVPMSCPINTAQSIYSGLVRKSYALTLQTLALAPSSPVSTTINNQITARNYKQTLRNDKSALQRALPASAHV